MFEFTPNHQERWNKCVNIQSSGDIDGALFQYKALFRGGVIIAATEIANIYEFKKQYSDAIDWYRIGMREYDLDSFIGLANMFVQGKGVERDLAYAKEILRSEALVATDDHRLCLLLGNIYELESDPVNAKVYYERSYQLGNLIALKNLSSMDKSEGRFCRFIIQRVKLFFKAYPIMRNNHLDLRLREFK